MPDDFFVGLENWIFSEIHKLFGIFSLAHIFFFINKLVSISFHLPDLQGHKGHCS